MHRFSSLILILKGILRWPTELNLIMGIIQDSEPNQDKRFKEGRNHFLSFCSAEMQGWRNNMVFLFLLRKTKSWSKWQKSYRYLESLMAMEVKIPNERSPGFKLLCETILQGFIQFEKLQESKVGNCLN